MERRDLLRAAAATVGAPMISLGRYRLFAGVPRQYSARAIDLVQSSIVVDMLGLLTLDWAKLRTWHNSPQSFLPRDFGKLASSGITVFHPAVELPAAEPLEATRKNLNSWRLLIEQNSEYLRHIACSGDFIQAKRHGQIGILLGTQNSEHFRTLDDIRKFHKLGQRVSQLTYNSRNRLGYGCLERGDGGLTSYGAEVVQAMNRIGMAIDVSHSGDRTTLDAFAASKNPVLITHSNCRALVGDHPRCKSDEVIRRMASTGSVMGITGIRVFVRNQEPTTIEHVLDHFDHVVKLAGVDHVGIGSDTDLDGRDILTRSRRRLLDIRGLDHPRRIFDLTEGLIRRRYSDQSIQLMLGGNFRRVLSDIWPI
jgi:membrane dipeptidase